MSRNAKQDIDLLQLVEIMAAGLSGQVGADSLDDEPRAFDRCSAVASDVGRSGGDERPRLQFAGAVDRAAISLGTHHMLDEPATRLMVDLNRPLAETFTKRKMMSVNISGPVLGREAAMAINHYAVLSEQLVGYGFKLGLFRGPNLPALQ